MKRFLVLLVSCFLLAACSKGPGVEALHKDMDERLLQAFPANTLTMVSLERRGSQSDSKAPEGETRRIVYFDAQFRLERDFDFGAWDGPGLAGLVSALGTGPKGISGVVSGGNKAGDLILAHATAVYKQEGDTWQRVVAGGYQPAHAPSYANNEAQGIGAILDSMRKIVDSVPREGGVEQRAIIAEELTTAYASIRARLVRSADGYAIAAGPEHGQYLLFAQALADGKRTRTVPLVTQGGEENIRLLREGKVMLALAQGDAALQAYEGTGAFSSAGPYHSLQALGSLYPEPVHVLVRADSKLVAFSDLAGKRVAIGRPGAASRTTALRVLQAHGLGVKDIQVVDLPLGEALVALRNKRVDAVIQVIGVPANSVRDAMAQVPLRVLPLSSVAIAALTEGRSGCFSYTIAAGTYATQKQPVRTVATAALLLVGSELSDAEVGTMTRFVYEKGQDFAARGSAQGVQVSAASAQQGLFVPLHASAARVLETLAKK